jgi:uncharacterized protein YutE (UPF0331/DUF86 family)
MDKLSQKINAELENIDEVFNEIPSHTKLPYLSVLELAGVAALLHNFYNGIENILKQILLSKDIIIPESKSWHKELLEISERNKIISEENKNSLGQYLAFRHFFSHAYAFDLYADKMEPLVENSQEVYSNFKKGINKYL